MITARSNGFLIAKKPFKVLVSLVTLVAFLCNTLFLDAAWAVESSAGLTGGGPARVGGPGLFKELNPDTFTLPEYLGHVRDSWTPPQRSTQYAERRTQPVIIHIQDAHCNYAAQKRIAEIIEYLNTEYGIESINLEGGAKDYDLSIFTGIKDKAIREKAADYFVREGVVNGAEYFAINNPEKVTLWGLEDTKLYIDNLRIYRDSLKYKEIIDKHLKTLTHILNNLKIKIYSKELLALDAKYTQYKAGTLDFKDYLSCLIKTAKDRDIDIRMFTNVYLMNQALEEEGRIDFKKADSQRDILIDKLSKRLPGKSLDELVAKTVEFKAERISRKDFYAYLTGRAKFAGEDMENFPDLKKYIVYISVYEAADKMKIAGEMDGLDAALKKALYQNDAQKELDRLSKNLAILRNIFDFSLTRDDYKYYLANERSFGMDNYTSFINKEAPFYKISARPDKNISDLDRYREEIARFYEYSFKRDTAFIDNMKFTKPVIARRAEPDEAISKTTIVITGGFHTENLADMFRKEGISYISIMPIFSNPKEYECPYFKLLSGEKNVSIKETLPSVLKNNLATASQLSPAIDKAMEEFGAGARAPPAEPLVRRDLATEGGRPSAPRAPQTPIWFRSPLCDLPNWQKYAEDAVGKLRAGLTLQAISLNIENFKKEFNDRGDRLGEEWGHLFGDIGIQAAAAALQPAIEAALRKQNIKAKFTIYNDVKSFFIIFEDAPDGFVAEDILASLLGEGSGFRAAVADSIIKDTRSLIDERNDDKARAVFATENFTANNFNMYTGISARISIKDGGTAIELAQHLLSQADLAAKEAQLGTGEALDEIYQRRGGRPMTVRELREFLRAHVLGSRVPTIRKWRSYGPHLEDSIITLVKYSPKGAYEVRYRPVQEIYDENNTYEKLMKENNKDKFYAKAVFYEPSLSVGRFARPVILGEKWFQETISRLIRSPPGGDWSGTFRTGGDEFGKIVWDSRKGTLRILKFDVNNLGKINIFWGHAIGSKIIDDMLRLIDKIEDPQEMMEYIHRYFNNTNPEGKENFKDPANRMELNKEDYMYVLEELGRMDEDASKYLSQEGGRYYLIRAPPIDMETYRTSPAVSLGMIEIDTMQISREPGFRNFSRRAADRAQKVKEGMKAFQAGHGGVINFEEASKLTTEHAAVRENEIKTVIGPEEEEFAAFIITALAHPAPATPATVVPIRKQPGISISATPIQFTKEDGILFGKNHEDIFMDSVSRDFRKIEANYEDYSFVFYVPEDRYRKMRPQDVEKAVQSYVAYYRTAIKRFSDLGGNIPSGTVFQTVFGEVKMSFPFNVEGRVFAHMARFISDISPKDRVTIEHEVGHVLSDITLQGSLIGPMLIAIEEGLANHIAAQENPIGGVSPDGGISLFKISQAQIMRMAEMARSGKVGLTQLDFEKGLGLSLGAGRLISHLGTYGGYATHKFGLEFIGAFIEVFGRERLVEFLGALRAAKDVPHPDYGTEFIKAELRKMFAGPDAENKILKFGQRLYDRLITEERVYSTNIKGSNTELAPEPRPVASMGNYDLMKTLDRPDEVTMITIASRKPIPEKKLFEYYLGQGWDIAKINAEFGTLESARKSSLMAAVLDAFNLKAETDEDYQRVIDVIRAQFIGRLLVRNNGLGKTWFGQDITARGKLPWAPLYDVYAKLKKIGLTDQEVYNRINERLVADRENINKDSRAAYNILMELSAAPAPAAPGGVVAGFGGETNIGRVIDNIAGFADCGDISFGPKGPKGRYKVEGGKVAIGDMEIPVKEADEIRDSNGNVISDNGVVVRDKDGKFYILIRAGPEAQKRDALMHEFVAALALLGGVEASRELDPIHMMARANEQLNLNLPNEEINKIYVDITSSPEGQDSILSEDQTREMSLKLSADQGLIVAAAAPAPAAAYAGFGIGTIDEALGTIEDVEAERQVSQATVQAIIDRKPQPVTDIKVKPRRFNRVVVSINEQKVPVYVCVDVLVRLMNSPRKYKTLQEFINDCIKARGEGLGANLAGKTLVIDELKKSPDLYGSRRDENSIYIYMNKSAPRELDPIGVSSVMIDEAGASDEAKIASARKDVDLVREAGLEVAELIGRSGTTTGRLFAVLAGLRVTLEGRLANIREDIAETEELERKETTGLVSGLKSRFEKLSDAEILARYHRFASEYGAGRYRSEVPGRALTPDEFTGPDEFAVSETYNDLYGNTADPYKQGVRNLIDAKNDAQRSVARNDVEKHAERAYVVGKVLTWDAATLQKAKAALAAEEARGKPAPTAVHAGFGIAMKGGAFDSAENVEARRQILQAEIDSGKTPQGFAKKIVLINGQKTAVYLHRAVLARLLNANKEPQAFIDDCIRIRGPANEAILKERLAGKTLIIDALNESPNLYGDLQNGYIYINNNAPWRLDTIGVSYALIRAAGIVSKDDETALAREDARLMKEAGMDIAGLIAEHHGEMELTAALTAALGLAQKLPEKIQREMEEVKPAPAERRISDIPGPASAQLSAMTVEMLNTEAHNISDADNIISRAEGEFRNFGVMPHETVSVKLGQGTYSTAYEMSDPRNVVKLVRLEQGTTDEEEFFRKLMLLHEAALMAKAGDIDGVAKIYAVGKIKSEGFPDRLGIIIERADTTLKEVVESGRALSAEDIMRLAVRLARILTELHKKGIWHLDIKPANIAIPFKRHPDGRVVMENGKEVLDIDKAFLIDFGIAIDVSGREERLRRTGGVLQYTGKGIYGTPRYMPLEALKQTLSEKTDVYALGAVLYEALTGLPPAYGGRKLKEFILIKTRLRDEYDLKSPSERESVTRRQIAVLMEKGATPGLAEAIVRSIRENKENRLGSAKEFLEMLARAPAPGRVRWVKAKIVTTTPKEEGEILFKQPSPRDARLVLREVEYMRDGVLRSGWIKYGHKPEDEKDMIIPQAEIMNYLNGLDIKGVYKAASFLEIPRWGKAILFEDLPREKGKDLRTLIKERAVSEKEAVDIILRTAEILKKLHEAGVYHWDIKLSNIWLTDEGEVIIIDFEFAFRTKEEFLNRQLYSWYANYYASQARAHVANKWDLDRASKLLPADRHDVYSLAMTLVYLMKGREEELGPSPAQHANMLLRLLEKEKTVTPELLRILQKALSDGESKYSTMDEFIRDMRAIQVAPSVPAAPRIPTAAMGGGLTHEKFMKDIADKPLSAIAYRIAISGLRREEKWIREELKSSPRELYEFEVYLVSYKAEIIATMLHDVIPQKELTSVGTTEFDLALRIQEERENGWRVIITDRFQGHALKDRTGNELEFAPELYPGETGKGTVWLKVPELLRKAREGRPPTVYFLAEKRMMPAAVEAPPAPPAAARAVLSLAGEREVTCPAGEKIDSYAKMREDKAGILAKMKALIKSLFQNLCEGRPVNIYVLGATPTDENNMPVVTLESSPVLTNEQNQTSRLINERSGLGSGNVTISHAVGIEKARARILEIAKLSAETSPKERVYCAISAHVLRELEKDDGLKTALGTGVEKFLAGRTMFNIVEDFTTDESGVRTVYLMPYLEVTLSGLSRINLVEQLQKSKNDLNSEGARDAIAAFSQAMGLVSNLSAEDVKTILSELLAAAKENPLNFFKDYTFRIGIPPIVKIRSEEIHENINAMIEAWQSV